MEIANLSETHHHHLIRRQFWYMLILGIHALRQARPLQFQHKII